MTFNPELIAKARKGEIAILNDGSVEELRAIIKEVWDKSYGYTTWGDKYYYLNQFKDWQALKLCNLPSHSVKDFFMPDTKDPETLDNTIQPRTYRVTREQMQEIYLSSKNGKIVINKIMEERFSVFSIEADLTDTDISMLNSIVPDAEVLKKYFPSYFFIPEGEPVLVRNRNDEGEPFEWYVRVSDGKGGTYVEGKTSGISTKWHETISFTKNPPK